MITLIVGGLFAALGAAIPQGRAARPLVVESEVFRERSGWSRVWKRLTHRRNRARQIQALPVLLELVARDLRGGATLRGALDRVVAGNGPLSASLRPVMQRVSAGERLGVAVDHWAAELDHGDADVVRAVFRLGQVTGAAMADALDRAGTTLRERADLQREVRSLTSQSRASGVLLAASPVVFLALLSFLDTSAVTVLLTTPVGWLCISVGLTLDAIGLLWMVRLTGAVAT